MLGVAGLPILILAALVQAPVATPPPPSPWGMPVVRSALRTLDEPALPAEPQPEKTVRLVIAPPFPSWRIVVTRLSLRDGAVEVTTKTLGDWHPGRGTAATLPRRRLPSSRWVEIEEMLRSGLWGYRPAPFPDPNLMDGSAWYLEASGPRGHIAVVQHSPPDNAFRKACQTLLALSGLDYDEREFVSWFAPR